MEDKIKNFLAVDAFHNMDDAYKEGYTDAAKRGLLTKKQEEWANMQSPTWDQADVNEMSVALSNAFHNLRQNPMQFTSMNSDAMAFITKWSTNPPNTKDQLEEVLRAFSQEPEKLGIIINNMSYPNDTFKYAYAILEGLKAIDYKEGNKNRIAPIYADKKGLLKQGAELVKSITGDFLGKYISEAKRKKMPNVSRAIFEEIEALKIPRSEGLAKILEKEGEIKGKLPGQASIDFKFMMETLKALSGTSQFKNALRSGRSMFELNESIADMVADEKDEKKRLEKEKQVMRIQFILSSLSYGPMTSGMRKKLWKTEYGLLKGTTFDKIGGGAFSKGIEYGFKGVVMLAHGLVNLSKNTLNKVINSGVYLNSEFKSKMSEAEKVVKANPNKFLAQYKAEAAQARRDYEAASRGGADSGKVNRLKKEMEQADLYVKTRELFDDRNLHGAPNTGTNQKKTALDTKRRIMAHWNFVQSGKLTDWELGSHSDAEKAYHHEEKDAAGNVTTKSKYNKDYETYLKNYLSGRDLVA